MSEINPNEFVPEKNNTKDLLSEKKFGRIFLLIIFIFSLIAFIQVIRVFIVDIILSAVFVTLFYPIYIKILKLFNNKRGIAAFVICFLILLGVLIPIVIISNIVVMQAIDFYHTSGPMLHNIIQKGDAAIIGKIKNFITGKFVFRYNIDWQAILNNITKITGTILANFINKTSKATFSGIIDLFIILFSMFYFFRDGAKILIRIKNIIPLNEVYKDKIVERFSSISRATVKGTILIALIQSFLGALTLFVFGIKTWLLLGVVMLVFAVIPFVGIGAVLIPTGIIKIISGSIYQGIAMICISIFFISTIDNFLRPRLVGSDSGLHDLIVFFSTLGGIGLFGPSGFIIGPLIAAIFLTILDIYSIEFKQHIEYSKK